MQPIIHHKNIVSILLVLSVQYVCCAQSAWTKQGPPGGPDLQGIAFSDSVNGMLVGNAGTIMRTTDAGISWQDKLQGMTNNLYGVAYATRSVIIAVGDSGMILRTTNNGDSWTQIFSSATRTIRSVSFADSIHGFAVGMHGQILRSTDLGLSWSAMQSGFTDDFFGVACTTPSQMCCAGSAGIIRSIDGGSTWETVDTNSNLRAITFCSAAIGQAVGGIIGGLLLQTTDGGLHWSHISTNVTIDYMTAIASFDIFTLVIVGSSGGSISCSFDNPTWVLHPIPACNGVHLFPDGHTLAVSKQKTVVDALLNLPAQTTRPVHTLFNVDCVGTQLEYAAGENGVILQTTNSGTAWAHQVSLTPQTMRCIAMRDSLRGIAVGDSGTLLVTTNSGGLWAHVATTIATNLYAAGYFDNLHCCIAGADGTLERSTNSGVTWTKLSTPTLAALRAFSILSNSVAIVVGDSGTVLQSTNAGASWVREFVGDTTLLNDVAHNSVNVLIAVASNGNVYRSMDSGITWSKVYQHSGVDFTSVSFGNDDTVLCCGNRGTLILSTDAGITWSPLLSGTGTSMRCIRMTSPTTGTMIGDSGVILRTTTDGMTESWKNQLPALAVGDFYSVDYSRPGYPFAISSNGSLVQSSDEGSHWNIIQTPSITFTPCLIKADHATFVGITTDGTIERTTDYGAHWQDVGINNTGKPMRRGMFFNPQLGTFVGDSGAVLQTTNGGLSWNVINTLFFVPFNDIWFTTTTTCYTIMDQDFAKSTNAGRTWSYAPTGWTELYRLRFLDSAVALIATLSGGCIRTTNAGKTWNVLITGTSATPEGIYTLDPANVFIYGDAGSIIRSRDSGNTWAKLNTGTTANLYGLAFEDNLNGIAVGTNSTIIHTTDGGYSWSLQSQVTTENFLGVQFADDNIGAAVGTHGEIVVTTDAGRHWVQRRSTSTTQFNAVAISSGGNILAVGAFGGVAQSTTFGTTWNVSYPTTYTLNAVALRDSVTFIAVGDSGIVMRTSSTGEKIISFIPGGSQLISIDFVNPLQGFSVSSNGNMFKTNDGGASWETLTHSGLTSVGAAKYLDSNNALISANSWNTCFCGPRDETGATPSATIAHSSDGGDTWHPLQVFNLSVTSIAYPDPSTLFVISNSYTAANCVDGGCYTDFNNFKWSTTGAVTWSGTHLAVQTLNYNAICATDARNVTIVGDNGTILHLTEEGYAQNPALMYLPGEVAFNQVPIGVRRYDTVVVRNGTNELLNINLVGISNELFAVSPIAFTLEIGDSADIIVSFQPQDTLMQQGFAVFSDDYFGNSDTIYFTGNSAAGLQVNKRALYFGSIKQGATISDSIEISNVGLENLVINNITSSDPVFTPSATALTLTPGNSQTLTITFHSDSVKRYPANLVITSNAPSSPDTITLLADTYSKVNDDIIDPKNFLLAQNYPNPINTSSTTINYTLEQSGLVTLKIFSLLGEEIETVFSTHQATGNHSATVDVRGLQPGVYFYRLEMQGSATTKAMVVRR